MGAEATAGQEFGKIETVKAVSDLNSPVTGEVIAINEEVLRDNNLFKEDPYGKGWLVKIRLAPGPTLDHLMTLEEYKKQIAQEGH